MNDPRRPGASKLPPWPLVALLALAAAVRLVFWVQARDLPFFHHPTGDSATYLALAHAILADGLLAPVGEPYRQGPLYPFFLASMQAAGWGLEGARFFQFLLGTANVALLWTLGRRLAGRTGAVVASLGALSGPLVFFEGEFLSISLAVFCLLLGLVAIGTRARGIPAGLLFGLAALAQPNLLIVGFGVGLLSLRNEAVAGRTLRKAFLFFVGLTMLPAVTLTRNLVEAGEPVLISSNGGINFFIGNNPEATGAFYFPEGLGLLNRTEGLFHSARDLAEQSAGRPLTDLEVDGFWWRRGLDFWVEQPLAALELTVRKILLTLNDYELPNHHDFETFKSRVPVLAILPTLGWVLPLAALGLLLDARRKRSEISGYFAVVVLSVALFFVTARYRLPLYLAVWPAAGLAIAELPSLARTRASLAGSALLVCAVAALCFWPLSDRTAPDSYMANLEGLILFENDRPDEARAAFEEALRLDPEHAEALNNLGKLAALRGNLATAHDYFGRAIAANPLPAASYFQLEELYRNAGDSRAALEILTRLETAREGRVGDIAGRLAYRRAFHVAALGDPDRAIALLEESVRREPDRSVSWRTLASLYRSQGREAEARHAEQRATAARR